MLSRILLAFTALATSVAHAAPALTLTIGDSLTAEYDTIPDVPGFAKLPTDYAKITVSGWESMSWVEVMSRLEKSYFTFGSYKALPDAWSVPRLSGYEYNWAIPGIDAHQYADFVSASVLQNFAYYVARQPLETQLKSKATRVVIWLGGNEFRANYGALYDGKSSASLVKSLTTDIGRVIDFVKAKNSRAQIVVCNVPDLGATPSKKAAHPDPAKRARVTAATVAVNAQIARLAASKRVAVADVYSPMAKLAQGGTFSFGAVAFVNDQDANNNPRYAFTRDGLHPNTAVQILNARIVVDAFNKTFAARIPQITDAQALTLLGIDPNAPITDWLAARGVTDKSLIADTDQDGMTQLVEYAFGTNPAKADADTIPATLSSVAATVSIHYKPAAAAKALVRVQAQYSTDLATWIDVPAKNVKASADGSYTAVVPATKTKAHLRLKVSTVPPVGSTLSVYSAMRFE